MVKLSDIVEALEDTSLESSYYYNKETNEILWHWELNEENSTYKDEFEENDKIILMFDLFTKDDYNIMQDFIDTIKNNEIKEKLYEVTRGKGAFSRFKFALEENNIIDNWYKYRDNKYKDIAKKWCVDNNIDFEEDC